MFKPNIPFWAYEMAYKAVLNIIQNRIRISRCPMVDGSDDRG